MPRSIAHFWCLEDVAADHSATLDRGFYTLLFLVKAIARRRLTGIHLAVISTGVHDVTGEEIVSPSKAAILGALSSISQEYPGFSVCNLDWSRQQSTDAVAGLISAFRSNQVSGVFCRRGGYYWKPVWEPLMTAPAASLIREGGVYLLVGGLGSIGLILSEFLAETAQAKLVLVGRSPFPDRADWEKLLLPGAASEELQHTIRRLQALEKVGASVITISADVRDVAAMEHAVSRAEDLFGPVDGVFHLAGVPPERCAIPISELTREACEEHFEVKASGLRILEEVFLRRNPYSSCCFPRSPLCWAALVSRLMQPLITTSMLPLA